MAIYHLPASNMGEGYTETEMSSFQDFIEAELRESGLDDDVYVVENPRHFIPEYREDIRECVEFAWEKWIDSDHNEMVR